MKKILALSLIPLFLSACASKDEIQTRTVLIKSEPEGATIVVNNFSMGKTPFSIEFESNEFGSFVKKQLIVALPQNAELYTQTISYPAYTPLNQLQSKIPEVIIFNMTKSPKDEGGATTK